MLPQPGPSCRLKVTTVTLECESIVDSDPTHLSLPLTLPTIILILGIMRLVVVVVAIKFSVSSWQSLSFIANLWALGTF